MAAREERPLELVPGAAFGGELPTVPRMNPHKPAEVGQPEAPSGSPQREPPPHPLGANRRRAGGPIASP
eukprot:10638942-Alexandrium_andersonii.AAC.1